MTGFLTTFAGGEKGPWKVNTIETIAGEPLKAVNRVEIFEGPVPAEGEACWYLRGAASHPRYTTREELDKLKAIQPSLGRPEATRAALIPIRKSAAWWNLAQDERRAILEERSNHIAEGLKYLPAVARKLHHSRDLDEPFDFITWFEFAPSEEKKFDELVSILRRTEEWKYVEREIDIRLSRI